tara:strand:- start:367 stop:1119 length:753 start_codon:yes stop_codon:yes gene_type:complete
MSNSFEDQKKELIFHFNEIYKKCGNTFHAGWGSYLFNGHNYLYDSRMLEKQKLIFDLAKNNKSVLEIGVYMGHSLLIMLLANPKLDITCIDIEDLYSLPAVEYLKENFKDANIKFLKGDSVKLLKDVNKDFDLFHIDGSHSPFIIAKETLLCLKIKKTNFIKVLFDDIDFMKEVKKNILTIFTVTKEITTECKGRNCYLEFNFSDNEIKKFKNFYIIYLFSSSVKRFFYFFYSIFFTNRVLAYIKRKYKS